MSSTGTRSRLELDEDLLRRVREALHSRPMTKNLVIVESPAKARTIERYLGEDYRVLASYGHVRDLPENPGKGKLGVDVEHDFAPEYVVTSRTASAEVLAQPPARPPASRRRRCYLAHRTSTARAR